MIKLLLSSLLIFTLIQCKSTKPAQSLATLENTYWKLSEVNGNPIITPAGVREPHFILTAERSNKKIKGFAGCNSITGSYTSTGENIKFLVASTKMMCPPAQMEIEDFFTKTLTTADAYKINGEVLEFFEDSTLLAVFNAVYLK